MTAHAATAAHVAGAAACAHTHWYYCSSILRALLRSELSCLGGAAGRRHLAHEEGVAPTLERLDDGHLAVIAIAAEAHPGKSRTMVVLATLVLLAHLALVPLPAESCIEPSLPSILKAFTTRMPAGQSLMTWSGTQLPMS